MSVPARDELMRLLSLSSVETIIDDANSAEEAFELAGRTVVERSDVLIAVWDGREAKGRGGTQHIVEFAEHGRYGRFAVPVVIIAPDGTTRRAVDSDIGEILYERVLRAADDFNGPSLAPESSTTIQEAVLDGLDLGADEPSLRALTNWIDPPFQRADRLADRCHRRYLRTSTTIFSCAGLSLMAAAYAASFGRGSDFPIAIELVLLAVVLVGWLIGRLVRWQQRWLAHRLLAERLRAALYLAFVTPADHQLRGHLERISSADSWALRCSDEVWRKRPLSATVSSNAARRLIKEHWIDGQIHYHERSAHRDERSARILEVAVVVLLTAAMLVAVAHLAHLFDSEHAEQFLTFASIALPAAGGAATGLSAQREYGRSADRHLRIAEHLRQLGERLDSAATEEAIYRLTRRIQQAVLDEVRDWFGTVKFHDIEPHV